VYKDIERFPVLLNICLAMHTKPKNVAPGNSYSSFHISRKKIGEGVRLSSSSAQLEEIPISDGQFFLKMMIAETLVAVSDNSTVWRFFEKPKI